MKVLLVHNFYQSSSPSGEDAVFRAEDDLLRSRGVNVVRYEKSNDAIEGGRKWLATFRTTWARETYAELSNLLKREKPDVAHFHNIWYLISPSAYYACRDAGVPVVQTLHNFRMFCTNGLFLRDGRICEDCLGKVPWRGAMYGCYRNSRLYSFPVVAAEVIHRAKGTWKGPVDAFIALTEFGKQKFAECGLPKERIFVKPNFLNDPPSPNYGTGDYAIFLGRLSVEKGLNVLLDALMLCSRANTSPLRVKIVGDGPLRRHLARRAEEHRLSHIDFLGRRDFRECLEFLSGACFVIMPSLCYENFPMVIREAYACGKPVIAPRLGAMAELVHDGRTGLLFDAGEQADLAAKLQWMTKNGDACREMGRRARTEFEHRYGADRNFDILMEIYRKVVRSKST